MITINIIVSFGSEAIGTPDILVSSKMMENGFKTKI